MSGAVAIGSGKAGVDRTWLAASLAHALARRGRRVLPFDGDLRLAKVDVQLGLGLGPDLASVMITDAPTAITDAYALIKVCRAEAAGLAPQLVVNQVASHGIGWRTYAGVARVCARFLGVRPELAGTVRHDPRVAEAIRQQVPFLVRSRTSPAAPDVDALARHPAIVG